MSNIILELEQKKLISPPSWLGFNTVYLAVMGSTAYGVTSESSDYDVCGFAVPKKEIMFPHLAGVILVPRSKEQGGGWSSFDQEDVERFTQYQQHHINDPSACAGKGREYDLTVFNIVKYFKLLMENNPNIIDSLFVPYECVLHSTDVGNMVRENRHMFLHKGAYPNFKDTHIRKCIK